jgi:hypothetical protein
MTVREWLPVLLAAAFNMLSGEVVINELYYDHPGIDTGHEFLELYNTSDEQINLEGWHIEKAGSQFSMIYTFPSVFIDAGSFLVVGESEVEAADLFAVLAFQNGGSATDGVRITSPDSLYTDTILYDSPNTNNLTDDDGDIGYIFAPAVTPGYSLIRYPDGFDTDCMSDWQQSHSPSPNSSNIISCDLAIINAEIHTTASLHYLYTQIQNLSTTSVDNSAGRLDIYYNNQPFDSILMGTIAPGKYWDYSLELGLLESGYHEVEIYLISIYDNNLDNNYLGCSLLEGFSSVRFNELMIKPITGETEWVELFVDNPVDNFVDNFRIVDAADNTGEFSLPDFTPFYQILCADIASLMLSYGLEENQLLECLGLPTLNNDGDALYLMDRWGTVLDSMEYTAIAGSESGITWERCNPYSNQSNWGHCISEAGHSAGKPNSIMYENIDMGLEFVDLMEVETGLEHHLRIKNMGIELPEEIILEIFWQRLNATGSGEMQETINPQSEICDEILHTDFPGEGYYEFIYTLYTEGDTNYANDQVNTFYNHNILIWVINEIMYHPFPGEPEWLELKRNTGPPENELFVVVQQDSCRIQVNNEFVILTGSAENAEFLRDKYGEELEIFEGLPRLPDTGCTIGIADKSGSIIEEFFYEPAWNQEKTGYSIERVNPQLPARADNWGRSVCGSTPGYANSIFTETAVTTAQLKISPPIFNPHKGEHTAISFQNTGNLNQVRIEIYDLKGRKLRIIADQKFQGSEGIYFWDGRDRTGKIVNTGIYLVLIECSGSYDNYIDKKTVVVKR